MKDKIREYVEYQFRFDHTINVEETKAEIIANLCDRYDELFAKYQDEEKAYIETIKQMGDFNAHQEDIPEEYSIKPSWPDIAMIVATVFAVMGFAVTVFSLTYGAIMVAISISLYAASCYYLYHYSQYVKKTEMDISKHNLLLEKIFQYMKTNFVFWGISISLIASNLIQGIVSLFAGYGFLTITSLFGTNPSDIFAGAYSLLYIGIITLVISLVACYIILTRLYKKLMRKYYYLTGNQSFKSHIQIAEEFLNGEEKEKVNFLPVLKVLTSRVAILLINMFTFLLAIDCTVNIHNYRENGQVVIGNLYNLNILTLADNSVFSIIANVMIYVIIVTNLLMLVFMKKEIFKTLALLTQPVFLISALLSLIFAQLHASNYEITPLIAALIMDAILIILYFINLNKNKTISKTAKK